MFPSYTYELEYLVSGGMLIIEDRIVSFVHQSFLDSFLLEEDLAAIFASKHSLLSLVISWGTQMPIYRYRLSALLQNIIDADQALFVKQAKEFLDSDQVHYYYKAAVFETIGQITTPISAIFKLIDEYYTKDAWHRLILQTVFERHPVFFEHLSTLQDFDLLSEEGYPLLVSMRYYSPDFVVAILRKSLESKAIDPHMIMSVLGTDIDVEAEALFDLRIDIYRNNPSFLSKIDFINLKRAQPDHVSQVLTLVLSNVDTLGPTHVYIDDKERPQFCKENHNNILRSLFDPLCNSAKNTPLSLHATMDYCERFWLPRQFESSVAREIVELVKGALKILAVTDPERALSYISRAGRFKNGISNELALATVLELPVTYSDSVIEWLLDDFDCHILDCISNEYDYLSTCKEILKKHSPSCSSKLFAALEDAICHWNGDREHFIDLYKRRIEINRSAGQFHVFWPAWGHLQKALLPFLDSARTTQRTKELLAVLNRNEWVRSDSHHAGILSGPARSVLSTIHQNAAHLSDKTWLEIVRANVDERHSSLRGKDDGEYYYESSHWSFAQDLGSCAKKDPSRFSKLLLKFPKDCYEGYYSSVLYSLSDSATQAVDFNLLCDVIRYSETISSDNISMAITHIIRGRPEENWPEDIIDYLIKTATGNLKPVGNEKIVSSRDDPFPSPNDMLMAVLNSPRGSAVDTIGELLLNHDDLFEPFLPVMNTLQQDESDVIRFGLVKCAAAFIEYDPTYSRQLLDAIIRRDFLALYSPYAFWVMRTDLSVLEEHYCEYLKQACASPNPKLVVHAAQLVCITAILTSNEQILAFLYSHSWPKEALDKICLEATYAFETEEYRDISQTILEHFLEFDADSLHSINHLFHENRLDLRRDEGFIIKILQERGDIDTASAFIDFIKTQDTEISGFAEIIKTAVESISDEAKGWQKYRIEDGLVQVIVKLIDTARGNDELTECCLEILDEIYRKRIMTDSAVSKLLEGAD